MIVAMPMSRGRLAAHFTKAQRIGFFNEYHQLITSFDNPALEGNCRAKAELLRLFQAQKTDIVIVQHIGERILGKLLAAGISVSQGDKEESIEVLLCQTKVLERRLVDASMGRASLNHAKKGGCCGTGGSCGSAGGCDCGGIEADSVPPSVLLQPSVLNKSMSHQGVDTPVAYGGFRPFKG